MGSKTDLIISIHKDLKDYERFIRKLKCEWRDNIENVEVFLSSINEISKGYDLSSPAIQKITEKVIYSIVKDKSLSLNSQRQNGEKLKSLTISS